MDKSTLASKEAAEIEKSVRDSYQDDLAKIKQSLMDEVAAIKKEFLKLNAEHVKLNGPEYAATWPAAHETKSNAHIETQPVPHKKTIVYVRNASTDNGMVVVDTILGNVKPHTAGRKQLLGLWTVSHCDNAEVFKGHAHKDRRWLEAHFMSTKGEPVSVRDERYEVKGKEQNSQTIQADTMNELDDVLAQMPNAARVPVVHLCGNIPELGHESILWCVPRNYKERLPESVAKAKYVITAVNRNPKRAITIEDAVRNVAVNGKMSDKNATHVVVVVYDGYIKNEEMEAIREEMLPGLPSGSMVHFIPKRIMRETKEASDDSDEPKKKTHGRDTEGDEYVEVQHFLEMMRN